MTPAAAPANACAKVSTIQCGALADRARAAINATIAPSKLRRMPMRSMRAARKNALAAVAAP
ncbi:hypothetical protein D3C81_2209590 [compost metagenome]